MCHVDRGPTVRPLAGVECLGVSVVECLSLVTARWIIHASPVVLDRVRRILDTKQHSSIAQ